MARACAAQTNACYLKLAGPSLVQMFIGDGAKLVRDAFELAKEKAPAIIFIDELDAIGTKRFDSEKSGDREVQRTMLELLNQLDGFSSDERIKVRDFILYIYCCGSSRIHVRLPRRSSRRRTASIFLTLPCSGPAVLTGKLNSLYRTRPPVPAFLKSTRERWPCRLTSTTRSSPGAPTSSMAPSSRRFVWRPV